MCTKQSHKDCSHTSQYYNESIIFQLQMWFFRKQWQIFSALLLTIELSICRQSFSHAMNIFINHNARQMNGHSWIIYGWFIMIILITDVRLSQFNIHNSVPVCFSRHLLRNLGLSASHRQHILFITFMCSVFATGNGF